MVSVESKFDSLVREISGKLKQKELKKLSHLFTLKDLGYFNDNLDLVIDTENFNIQFLEEAIRIYVFCMARTFPEHKSLSFSVIVKPPITMKPSQAHFTWLIKFFAYQEASDKVLRGHYSTTQDITETLNNKRIPYKFDVKSMKFRFEEISVNFVEQ